MHENTQKFQKEGAYFSVRHALSQGLTYKQIRNSSSKGFIKPLHGIYIAPHLRAEHEHSQITMRKNHLLLVKAHSEKLSPKHFYSHFTAAVIWGLPVQIPAITPIWTSRFKPAKPLVMNGVVSHGASANLVHVIEHQGLPTVSAVDAWLQLVPLLSTRDAIALGDALLYTERMPGTLSVLADPLATKTELHEAIMRPYRRNRQHLLALYDALSVKCASPPESHLRLLLTECGYQPEELDFDIYCGSGQLLGCSEIAYPSRKIVFEYEGDHHRTQKLQWYRDIEKYNAYRNEGWFVVRVTAEMLYRQPDKLRDLVARTFNTAE